MTSPDMMHMKHEEAYLVDPTPPSSDAAVVRADDRREDENVDSEDDTTERDSEDNNMQKDSKDPAPVHGVSGTIILPMQGSEFRRNDKGDVLCHVEGCGTVMSDETAYFRRYKICRKHLKSNYLIVAGIQQRFCQQCGKFHEVEKFDGTKRNCRATLVRHNRRRKKTSRAKRKKSASEDEDSDTKQPNVTWEHPGMGGMLNSSPVNVDILKAYYGVPNPNDAFPPALVNTIAELERLIGREVIHHCLQSSQPPQMWQQNGYATNNIFQGNGMHRYSPAPVHQSQPMMNAFHQYGIPMSAPQHPYTSGGMPMPPPSARKQGPKKASDSMMDQTASDILMRMKNSLPPKSQYMRMPM
ncbi:hypothetical protein M9435_000378 [Picochlorum sp. BPE23]|nr:hypothetical protein M9435_000378 [Picochlorum sp. BPE23]